MNRNVIARISLFAFFLTISVAPAFAQAERGDKELLVSGSISSNISEGSSDVEGNLIVGIGFFVTNGLELGAQPGISIRTGQSIVQTGTGPFGIPIYDQQRETTTTGLVRFFVRQHFGRAKVAPYVGGNVFMMSTPGFAGSESSTTSIGAGEFGLKNYLSESTALDLNLSVGTQLNAPEGSSTPTNVRFQVGITHLF
jgi:hypothetical protein